MITILRWINWSIAALSLWIHSWSRSTHIFAHSHLLCVRKLTLQLVLLLIIPTLASTLVCWRCTNSYKVGWLWSDNRTTCVLNTTLNTLLINIWSRTHGILNVWGLTKHVLAGASTLTSSYGRYTKSTCLRDVEALVLLLHGTSFRHLMEGVIAAVSLTFWLIWSSAKTTCCPLLLLVRCWTLSLWIQWNVGWCDILSILVLLNIIYLDVIETIVEITDI